MQPRQYDIRKYAIRIAVVLAVLLVLFVCYDNLFFRLKDTSPSLGAVPDSSSEIRYSFSQPVKSIGKVSVNDSPVEPVIEGKTVTIPFTDSLDKGSDYTILVEDVKSEWLGMGIGSIERSFQPEYIEFSKLSEEERKRQVDNSNSGQVDDPFISKNAFPIFNERWQIDAVVDTSSRMAILNVKFFKEIPNYDDGGKVTRVSDEVAETYRKEVLKAIQDDGGDPGNYTIVYENPYLYEKYSEGDTH